MAEPPPDAAFTPPTDDAKQTYEIEPEWQQEKAARPSHINTGPPKRTLPIAAILAIVGVLGALGGGAWWWTHRAEPEAKPAVNRADLVVIRIMANPQVDITINGMRVGKTPLTVHRRRSTKSIVIGTSNPAAPIREVIPDRDFVIDVSPR